MNRSFFFALAATSLALMSGAASAAVGFVDVGGTYTIVNPPGSTSTEATSINDSGAVTGYYYNGSTNVGFVYAGGTYTIVNPPGSTYTVATSINDSGAVTGYYYNGSTYVGFVDVGGTYTTFNPPGSTFTLAYSINDSGAVTGTASAPVPEPSGWALMLIGFGGLGGVLRNRRRGAIAAC
jgi:hypothetical protein